MARFYVGQRVRKIAVGIPVAGWVECVPIGTEGTVTALSDSFRPDCYTVAYDLYGGDHAAQPHMLAPLTDPRADEFIQDMERYARIAAPLLKPLTEEELARVRGGG